MTTMSDVIVTKTVDFLIQSRQKPDGKWKDQFRVYETKDEAQKLVSAWDYVNRGYEHRVVRRKIKMKVYPA